MDDYQLKTHEISQEVLDALALEYVKLHITPETTPYEYVTLYWSALDSFQAETQNTASRR